MTRFTLCTSVVAAMLLAAPPAMAKRDKPAKPDSGRSAPAAAITDCTADGDLDRVYSPGALGRALRRMPSDVAQYTDCDDVLRFARAAGPTIPVTKRRRPRARLRALCVGVPYEVTISAGGKTLGTATVPACRRGTKIVRVPISAAGRRKAKKRALATVVAKPNGKSIQFVARLTGLRR